MATDAQDPDLPFWLRPGTIAAFVAALTVLRFTLAASTGLVRDEGYYTFWSFAPSAGYLDHPPMIAWMIAVGRALLGEGEAGVRLFAVLSTPAISFAMWRTGRLLWDARIAGLAVIWYNLTLAGGLLFIAVPDPPSVTFWALAIWTVAEFGRGRNANWWLVAGLFAGLALLSKYTSFFLGAGLLLYLVASRERLQWFRLWQVWAGGLIALLVFLPNLIWNAQNSWASFAHQGQRLSSYGLSFGSMPGNFGDLVAGQALATGLFLFILIVVAVAAFLLRRDVPGRAELALPVFTSLPIVLYFIAYTAQFRVEANWLLPVWPMLSLAGAWAAVRIRPKGWPLAVPLALLRWAQAPVGLVLLGLIYAQAMWQPFALGQAIDRTRDMRGWDVMRAEVEALAAATGASWIASAADYGLAGQLASYGRFAGSALAVRAVDDPARWSFLAPVDAALLSQPGVLVLPAWAPAELPLQFFSEAVPAGEARRIQASNGEELERFRVYRVNGPLPGTAAALGGG